MANSEHAVEAGTNRRPGATPRGIATERAQWRQWARDILAQDDEWMIVDTETTGHGDADIIEFAAVTPSGRTLVDTLIRPRQSIPLFITELTGISEAMVADASPFAVAYHQVLLPQLASRKILAYNVSFDVPVIRKNISRHCGHEWQPVDSACLMRAYAHYRSERYPAGHAHAGRLRVHKLADACRQMGIAHEHAHRALGDCQVSALLLQAMAR